MLRFLLQFNSPLIYVLLAAALITGLLGERVDALVILGVVVVNAIVGFVQESRAEKALTALAAMARTTAVAVRDGARVGVPAADLVRGDLVALEAGDKVPADLRLLRTDELAVDESALTGESVPVTKDPAALPEVALADRTAMAFSGTLVTHARPPAWSWRPARTPNSAASTGSCTPPRRCRRRSPARSPSSARS